MGEHNERFLCRDNLSKVSRIQTGAVIRFWSRIVLLSYVFFRRLSDFLSSIRFFTSQIYASHDSGFRHTFEKIVDFCGARFVEENGARVPLCPHV